MLLARAFWFAVNPRALLAVAAVALAVAYALVAVGVVTALGTESEQVEKARTDPGFVFTKADGAAFPDGEAPPGATLLRVAILDGMRVATLEPWPFAPALVFVGSYAGTLPDAAWAKDLKANQTRVDLAPPDAFTVPPERFALAAPDHTGVAVAAFLVGKQAPSGGGSVVVPWRGVGEFYSAGAEETRSALGGVALAAGLVTALLSSGFVHLEVHARRRDLGTVEALAGRRVVSRLVVGRTVVLVGAGLLLGTGFAALALRLGHLVGAASFALDPLWTAIVLSVATLAGILAGSLAGLRAFRTSPVGERTETTRFRGPFRFLLVTPRVFAGVFVATLIATTVLTVVVETAEIPVELFGGGEGTVVLLETKGNPLRGQADRFLGANAHRLEGVERAMPETYAPTVWQGRPLLVKGTDIAAWRSFSSPGLVRGAWPEGPGEGLIGDNAARRLGVVAGDVLVLPMSYHKGVERVRVVGVHETGGLADDELFVDLDTAGRLAGLPADRTTLVRLLLTDPDASWAALAPNEGIAFVDLTITPVDPAPLSPAVVEVHALNFAATERTRGLAVRMDGVIAATETVRLPGHTAAVYRFEVVTPRTTSFELEVNPTREVGASFEGLSVSAPPVARPGDRVGITVRYPSGDAAPGAEVLVDGTFTATTDAAGRAFVVLDGPALRTVSAVRDDRAGGAQVRVAPPEWDDEAHFVVERLFVHPSEPLDGGRHRVRAEAVAVNLGGRAGERAPVWSLDGRDRAGEEDAVALGSGERWTLSTTFTVSTGTHAIGLFGSSTAFTATARPSGPQPPRTVEEVLAAKRAEALRSGSEERTEPFLEDVFAGFGTATSMVVIATMLHAGSLVWVGVVREVRERQGIVATLHAIGAGDHQVEWRSVRDAVVSSLPGVVAGVVAAIALLAVGREAGWPLAFGHVLPTQGAWGVRIKTGVALLVLALGAAFYAVQGRRRRAERAEAGVSVRRLVRSAR